MTALFWFSGFLVSQSDLCFHILGKRYESAAVCPFFHRQYIQDRLSLFRIWI